MRNWEEFKNRTKNPFSRRLMANEFLLEPHPFQMVKSQKQCRYVMNQRCGWNFGKQPTSVDLSGNPIDPMDANETLTHEQAIAAWMIDERSTFDGITLVLPPKPKPILKSGEELYVVVGIHNKCVKAPKGVHQSSAWEAPQSSEWIADWISLGKPHSGLNPRADGMYWMALHSEPIEPRFKRNCVVFSYGGVVALTQFQDETELKLLSSDALKTLSTWSKEGTVSSWF
ncbi:hypothetical protein G6704_02810 [Polynucleobacter paneuropaeus]|nr:hypothetical protein G6704_02810 [Polynucleobacter paneuropaeus]